MRRKDRQRDAAFAWDVLAAAPYATLAMTDGNTPYAIPITPAVDRDYGVIYFHCAAEGKKLDILRENAAVCLSAVSRMSVLPNRFALSYDSAVVKGMATEVTDEGERIKALLLLSTQYDPAGMAGFEAALERMMAATVVMKITPTEITGKQANPAQ